MTGVRTFEIELDAERISAIVASKGERSLSVCIPCRDEVATIGPIVQVIRDQLIDRLGIVDEVIVLDDRSTDGTAQVAALCGARVVSIEDIHESHGTGHGKGNALWASLLVSSGDIVVWLDGDVTSFDHDWVLRLVAPLLEDDSVALVKAYYHRPTDQGGGGRTTELVARPLAHAHAFTTLLGIEAAESQIVPLVVGNAERTLSASAALEDRGYLVTAIRPPTVPDGTARLRITFSAEHAADDVTGLADAVREIGLAG